MIYYVTIELQGQEQAVVKVEAKNELEAQALAYRVFFGNYDVYVDTEKPECADALAEDGCYLDEDGEEICEEEN